MNRLDGWVDDVMRAAQLAAALEVSATPKPGNVHRGADYSDTRFEHFLAGAVALGPAVRDVAVRGMDAASGRIGLGDVGIGRGIRRALSDVRAYHRGGNTHLGIITLFIPLAAAAGLAHQSKPLKPDVLRRGFKGVVEATTPEDAAEFCRAVVSIGAGWLGRLNRADLPDLSSDDAVYRILSRNITLFDVMKASAEWDGVAREISYGMKVSFTVGYPTLIETYRETGDINTAVVHTFLKILAETPDTFIARKVGAQKTSNTVEAVEIGMPTAAEISKKAKAILDLKGLLTDEGRRAVFNLDRELRSPPRPLNPGTSADITASSLMVAILCGLRP